MWADTSSGIGVSRNVRTVGCGVETRRREDGRTLWFRRRGAKSGLNASEPRRTLRRHGGPLSFGRRGGFGRDPRDGWAYEGFRGFRSVGRRGNIRGLALTRRAALRATEGARSIGRWCGSGRRGRALRRLGLGRSAWAPGCTAGWCPDLSRMSDLPRQGGRSGQRPTARCRICTAGAPRRVVRTRFPAFLRCRAQPGWPGAAGSVQNRGLAVAACPE